MPIDDPRFEEEELEPQARAWFTRAWVAWLALFILVEGIALFNKRAGDTLSEHVWRWFAIDTRGGRNSKAWRLRRVALLGFLAWLSAHFLSGGLF